MRLPKYDFNGEKLIAGLLQSLLISVVTFGVSYLKNIGTQSEKLNVSLIQLKYEIRTISDNQNSVNRTILEKLNSHEKRLIKIETKRLLK